MTQQERIDPGQGEHQRDEAERTQEFTGDDLADAQRRRQQQLERAEPLLLGEGAHGDHGDEDHQHHGEVVEQRRDHEFVQVESLELLAAALQPRVDLQAGS